MPETNPQALVVRELNGSSDVLRQAAITCGPGVIRASELISSCLQRSGRVLLCGNGGSAADCQHLAGELVGRFDRQLKRPGLSAIALTTDTAILTAVGNDFGFEEIFARQVEAIGKPGDVLLAISTSGKSPNVVRALQRARELGLSTVLLGGKSGGPAMVHADVAILVPSDNTQHIQEAHIALGHVMCALIEGSFIAS
jgi:D-sedoheptulose 7-phosphate isomerase